MQVQRVWAPEEDSIFGRTYAGVPNPDVPHEHPWPTRYHGPIWTVPGSGHITYAERPYARPPFMGVGAPPIFEYVTGHGGVDAALGAALGFVASPNKQDRALWAGLGAVATYAAGMAGLVGVGGVLLWLRLQSAR